MRIVNSAGGIVLKDNSILMLRKTNGDWVLPKGRIEEGESEDEAAIREVEEESGITATAISRLGQINYQYRNIWYDNEMIDKYVIWFLMYEIKGALKPQHEEGFVEARYIPIELFEEKAKFEEEKHMIRKAIMIR
jgi:8-oxo-dGTP pyrophosphatase MutT (NUDIX family)